jgi:NTE family protein
MSPGPDTMIMSAMDRRNLMALFAALPLLKGLDATAVGELADQIQWFSVPAGLLLYSSGEAADGLYVIINGAFGIYVAQPGGGARCIGKLSAGQTAGDMEVISNVVRTSTLIALRDSEVARLSRATFERLVMKHPQALRYIAKGLAEQVDALQQAHRRPAASPKTFAVVPLDASPRATQFGSDFKACLGAWGRTELLSSAHATDRTSHWFHRLERGSEFVVYMTDPHPSHWTRFCVRRADVVLLVGDAQGEPRPWAALDSKDEAGAAAAAAEIVLVHPGSRRACGAREWLETQPCRRLHHVHDAGDVARVTRLLTGRGVGLVLSGGGARGFAHIGVLRALHDAGIAVDSIGATSIGGIIGAGRAAGWDYPEMRERMHRTFVRSNPLSDYTLPLISLVAGRKVSRLLRQEFGDADIEDLRVPFYCVSANLTNGQLAVHRKGKLWLWLRASVGIPGVLPPVFTQRQAYVDGATLNNLPVDVMREGFRGPIIAVDAGGDRSFVCDLEMTEIPPLWRLGGFARRRRSSVNIMQILLRAGMLNSATMSIANRELADLVLTPPLEGVDLLDWGAFERVIDIGYRCAAQALERQGSMFTTLPSRG